VSCAPRRRRMEETHLWFCKQIYPLTPRRTDTLDTDMFAAYIYTRQVLHTCRMVSSLTRACAPFILHMTLSLPPSDERSGVLAAPL
jgi:hypothetical protein